MTVNYLIIGNDATEGVKNGVEDKTLKGSLGITHGMRDALNYGLEDLWYASTRLARCAKNLATVAAQKLHNLVLDLLGVGTGHINLVENGNDDQIVLNGLIEVRNGLSLNALRSIDNEQSSLACGNGTRDLVGEVHVTWGVDEIEDVFLPIGNVIHLNGVALDGNATFAFQIHIVQNLGLHILSLNRLCILEQTVG